ncbi:Sororin-B [Liparis tanakae]|uniref:Sororin-B n=1 Tax=Liparis tanakae TaxID=230148 RepID=A0A4Z2H645_9TELE|nr:Sororin-B [Liparis tanakae]
MAPAAVAVKRSITVRKIAPRKTVAPSEHDKENTPRRSVLESGPQKKPQVSTPRPVAGRGVDTSGPVAGRGVDTSGPVAGRGVDTPVRRSYSRLGEKSLSPGEKSLSPGEKSLSSPDCRGNMFGFDKLQTPEVGPRVLRPRSGLDVSCAPSAALNSFTSLLEAEEAAGLERDLHIPGVVLVKEKRTRRKKVQQIGTTELDALAARLNAEFEEAEEFELLVE